MLHKANRLFDRYEEKCLELGLSVPVRENWVQNEIRIHNITQMPKHLKIALAEEAERSKELHKMYL